jgi:hypothetical protein
MVKRKKLKVGKAKPTKLSTKEGSEISNEISEVRELLGHKSNSHIQRYVK